jgi:hypothetical protein
MTSAIGAQPLPRHETPARPIPQIINVDMQIAHNAAVDNRKAAVMRQQSAIACKYRQRDTPTLLRKNPLLIAFDYLQPAE